MSKRKSSIKPKSSIFNNDVKKPDKKLAAANKITESDIKSDSDDDVYDDNTNSAESESEEEEVDADEIVNEDIDADDDKPAEVDDEDDGKKEASEDEPEAEADTDIDTVDQEADSYATGEDGCMYNFVSKKKILRDKDDDDEEYYDDEVFDDDNTLSNDIVKPEDRITHPVLFKYERVRMLGVRTKQISLGSKSMIKNVSDLGPKEIARLELKNKIIPFIIERVLPNGKRELWKLNELEINN